MMEEKDTYQGKSGIVFPEAWQHAVPQQHQETTSDTLLILKRWSDVQTAKQLAEAEYNTFFAEFHAYIHKSTHMVLRERYAHYSQFGYLIRVEVEAPALKMAEIKLWTDEHIHSDRTG